MNENAAMSLETSSEQEEDVRTETVKVLDLPTEERQSEPESPGKEDVSSGLDRIGGLAESVATHFHKAIEEIEKINFQTKILSINAQVEAARAGTVGNAFGVVASEMVTLSERTAQAANGLATETEGDITSLNSLISTLGTEIRGTRLSDLALTNIDVIDRNLYERTCDVRWWSTDSSVVDALTHATPQAYDHASKRLGVILDSYTVYFDIVLCDLNGRVVANGRKSQFACEGTDQSDTPWFQAAINSRDGSEFGFQSVHRSSTLAGGSHVLIYSAGVRQNGDANGRLLGVMGVVFNWEALGQTIVNSTLISRDEKANTRVCIVDQEGLVLADTSNRVVQETLKLPEQKTLFAMEKGHVAGRINNQSCLIAHARAPGFETYSTNWHSLIIQRLK